MTPKSVSGSTRILALGAVLAWPVWGWAETLGEKAIRESGGKWVPCAQLYGPSDSECRVEGDRIHTRIDVRNGGGLEGRYGNGPSPVDAIRNHWKKLTELKPHEYLVADAMRAGRKGVKWNGFMWVEVKEDGR